MGPIRPINWFWELKQLCILSGWEEKSKLEDYFISRENGKNSKRQCPQVKLCQNSHDLSSYGLSLGASALQKQS